jgi:hypothetical protein
VGSEQTPLGSKPLIVWETLGESSILIGHLRVNSAQLVNEGNLGWLPEIDFK